MNVIIPCAGLGSRFKNDGFIMPKPLVRCMMKPFISWVIESIQKSSTWANIYITVVRDINYDLYYEAIAAQYNVTIIYLDNPTTGAAETVKLTAMKIPPKYTRFKTVCFDCDNFYTTDIISLCLTHINTVITFKEDTLDCFSFVICDRDGNITDIAEKKRISDLAVCGVYAFEDVITLQKYTSIAIDSRISGREVYMSDVIVELIRDGVCVTNETIEARHHVCLGTPAQMYTFYNKVAANPVAQHRVCFDLDETLLTKPKSPGDYTTCVGIQRNIDLCNYLKHMNHYIIIHTARRMRTHNGNVGKIIKDVGKITIDSLEANGIMYDELSFGKPYADMYIDDKALNANGDLQKDMGIFVQSFETRCFNSIKNDILHVIVKESTSSLVGEIYWYQHIPSEIKDMFPIFINNDDTSYTVERVDGTTLSDRFVTGTMSPHILVSLLNSIRRIHNSLVIPADTVHDSFYITKLQTRIDSFDYSHICDNIAVVEMFKAYFEKYSFVPCNIHGDPVFTNIIINTFDKMKFIDMRGSFGDGPSLLGDPLYDFAKINQSIIGYDFVLKSIPLNETCIRVNKTIFDCYILDTMGPESLATINMITKYLIFTMIPCHTDRDTDIHSQFIRLIL